MRATSSGSISSNSSNPTVRPGRLHAGLHAGVAHRDALDHEPGPDLVVLGEQAVGVRDEDAAARVGVRGTDLADRVRLGAGGGVGALEHLDLARLGDGFGEDAHLVGRRDGPPLERDDAVLPSVPRAAAAAASAASRSPCSDRSAVWA